ncbi:hypothetical protein TPHA_0G00250 [Tetrapisispora phaffii CBS 4417]|uniref:EF-hand domain-containing protein n=1 Tax=Tetrapisispora phaffii (strain ATCC 24235 / CBS 4417 / NBRC 1672 / NRRL Y-8282 / UCD 70-5) TaxID=1071381 RepID=G8BVD5_TETPH|nr:hypothetical protein TPHA_0G00250 [Tetrapisispora phaffii CBS 4417]CCE63863.1 hypothetical protein TPHA_0G00250 [Tetrapisispora phaffii CBS 4417]
MHTNQSLSVDQISPELINKLKNAFEIIDENGDGAITEADLSSIFKTLGIVMSSDEIKSMLGNNDESEGKLNYPEFLAMMGNILNRFNQKKEVVKKSFEVLSKNSNIDVKKGTIPKQTLLNYLEKNGYENAEIEFKEILMSFSNDKSVNNGDFKIVQFLETVFDE